MKPSRLTAYLGVIAGVTTAFGLIAAAQAETITVWWNKGYFPAEDAALQATIKKWEDQTGNKVNLSFYSGADIPTKIISAITSGNVPDVAYADVNDFAIAPQQAWKGTLADVSDVVEPLKDNYTKTALLSAYLYNSVDKKRSYYAVPMKQQALHDFYWRPLLEAAGYKDSDIPTAWDDYWKFWEGVQDKLRDQGQRVYALGLPVSTVDTDNYYTFNQYMLGYGGRVVNTDGTLNLTDQTRQAAIKTLTFIADAFNAGYIPQSALNWGDPDNNVAFFSKQIIMTNNATLSIPVAKFDDKQLYEHDIVTREMPHAPDGKPMTSLVAVKVAIVPKAAEHIETAKAFLKFFVTPENLGEYLAAARGRWMPVMPEIIKNNPSFWTETKDPHIPVAVKQEIDGPTEPWPMAYNPAYAQVNAEEIWGRAEGDVLVHGKTPEEAVDAAFDRIKEIFSQYSVGN
jgi:multiple sugar transport system substrate-binding protein